MASAAISAAIIASQDMADIKIPLFGAVSTAGRPVGLYE